MVIPPGWQPPPAVTHAIRLEPADGGFYIIGTYREFIADAPKLGVDGHGDVFEVEAPGEPKPPEGGP